MRDFKLPIESEKTLIEKKTDVAIYREININCWQREITMRIYRLLFLSRWATARQRSVFWREILSSSRSPRSLSDSSKWSKALYIIVLNQMSPRHISGILYEYPQFTMWLPLILVKAYFTVYSWNRKCVWASFWQIWTEKRVFCWNVMTFWSMALLTKCLAGS